MFLHLSFFIILTGLFTNRMLCFAICGSIIGQLLVVYAPPLQHIFQTEALAFTGMLFSPCALQIPLIAHLTDLLFLAGLTSSVFWVSELKKLIERTLAQRHARYSSTIVNVGKTNEL
jgi:Ca2+-transporting ATPase